MQWDIVTGEKITRRSVAVGPHRILDLVGDAVIDEDETSFPRAFFDRILLNVELDHIV